MVYIFCCKIVGLVGFFSILPTTNSLPRIKFYKMYCNFEFYAKMLCNILLCILKVFHNFHTKAIILLQVSVHYKLYAKHIKFDYEILNDKLFFLSTQGMCKSFYSSFALDRLRRVDHIFSLKLKRIIHNYKNKFEILT